jgi:hypothetical protein
MSNKKAAALASVQKMLDTGDLTREDLLKLVGVRVQDTNLFKLLRRRRGKLQKSQGSEPLLAFEARLKQAW